MNEQSRTPETERPVTPLRAALSKYRGGFIAIALFSSLLNILMLVSPVYMLQMYDRMLPSASAETLLMLTLIAVFLLTCFGLLDWVRQRLMQRIALALGLNMANDVLSSAFRSNLASQGQSTTQPVRDLDSVRQFMGSPTIFAFFDVPWVPIFTAVIFMFHPLLGAVAAFGAVVIFTLGMLAEFRFPPADAGRCRGRLAVPPAAGVLDAQFGCPQGHGHVRRADEPLAGAASTLGVLPVCCRRPFERSIVHDQGIPLFNAGRHPRDRRLPCPARQVDTRNDDCRLDHHGPRAAADRTGYYGLARFVTARQAWRRVNALLGDFGAGDAPSGPDLPRPKGKVEAENLSAVPPGGEVPVLRGVNFTLQPGTLTGLIGPSGSGKSSLASVMMGVWQPAEGALRLDGAEIDGWPDHLRLKHFGYLPQTVELFEGNVADNISRLEEPEADSVIGAAKLAGCHDVIMRLPGNYSCPIGAGGRGLSAGQRQRVALARGPVRPVDPAFIVLDEPDSNLDAEGQEALAKVLDALRERKITTVLITHNLRLLRRVDQIGVMKEGQLASFGPRDEVLGQFAKPKAQPGPQSARTAKKPAGPARPIQVKYTQ